jgi:hypothetical protein
MGEIATGSFAALAMTISPLVIASEKKWSEAISKFELLKNRSI